MTEFGKSVNFDAVMGSRRPTVGLIKTSVMFVILYVPLEMHDEIFHFEIFKNFMKFLKYLYLRAPCRIRLLYFNILGHRHIRK